MVFSALDIIDCMLHMPQSSNSKKCRPKSNFIRLHFCNKGVEAVNLSSILNCKDVLQSVLSIARFFKPPNVIYYLDPPTGSQIFNFNKFVSSVDVDRFLEDPSSLPCKC